MYVKIELNIKTSISIKITTNIEINNLKLKKNK